MNNIILHYLILTHAQPRQLARLIQALDAPNVVFTIHVDAKVDIIPFIHAVGVSSNIRFLGRRRTCDWGGFGLTEAIFDCMAMIVNDKYGKGDRIIVMSGSCYPLRSNEEIRHRLTEEPDAIFGEWSYTTDNHWFKHVVDNIVSRYRVVLDGPMKENYILMPTVTSFRGFATMRNLKRITYSLSNLIRVVLHSYLFFLPRQMPRSIDRWVGGSGWTSISCELASNIITWAGKHPDYIEYMKRTHITDEIFFQTIEYHITNKPPKKHLWYINWEYPSDGSPKILDMTDIDEMMASDKLFARKFHELESAPALDAIDRIRASAR